MLDQKRFDRVAAEAREYRLDRALLSVPFYLLFAIGWVLGTLALVASWAIVSIRAGWRQGRQR